MPVDIGCRLLAPPDRKDIRKASNSIRHIASIKSLAHSHRSHFTNPRSNCLSMSAAWFEVKIAHGFLQDLSVMSMQSEWLTSLKVWIKKTCGAIGRRRRVPAACHKIMRAHATCRLSNHGGKAIFAGFGGSACQMSASSPWVNQKGRFSWLEGLKSFQLSLAKATGYNFIRISNFEMGFGKQSIQLLQRGFIRGGVDRHKSVVTCDHTNATPKRLEILYNVVVQGSHHVLDPNFQDASWFQTPSTQEIARCQFSNAPSTWKTTISCRLGYDTIPATKWFHSVPSSHLRP